MQHYQFTYGTKPKIMVYGIYNSGKSTLVNALCGSAVAQVADRPMTDKITEYDQGRYILIDSPGINAPIQHEKIADGHLKDCHAILFVISSKGIFEDRVNYKKMIHLIDMGIPFYIILNDRGVQLPQEPEARKKVEYAHQESLNQIKRKIINNLIVYSGDKTIADRYEVIVLNAKRAWLGIERDKPALIEKSNINVLKYRIQSILSEEQAAKCLLAPISALERIIADVDSALYHQNGYHSLASQKEGLRLRLEACYRDVMQGLNDARYEIFDRAYSCMTKKESMISSDEMWEELIRILQTCWEKSVVPVRQYIQEIMPDHPISAQGGFYNMSAPDVDPYQTPQSTQFVPNQNEGYKGNSKDNSNTNQKFGIITQLLNRLKSPAKRYREEEERLMNEVAASNRQVIDRVAEEMRIRQDARLYINSVLDKMISQLKYEVTLEISNIREIEMASFDQLIQKENKMRKESQDMQNKLSGYRSELAKIHAQIV